MLIYFHANAEDIVSANELLDKLKMLLRVHVIAVEYPGYGLFQAKFQRRYRSKPRGLGNLSIKQKALQVNAKYGRYTYSRTGQNRPGMMSHFNNIDNQLKMMQMSKKQSNKMQNEDSLIFASNN